MFSSGSSRVNPSPTRTSIKEANDHLQLLHHRVLELEKTLQEQTDSLTRKEEIMQAKLQELTDAKDVKINELTKSIDNYEERIKKLEQLLREKEQQIEMLAHKCALAEEVAAYTPAVERLLSAMKKLPASRAPGKHGNRPKSRTVTSSRTFKQDRRSSAASAVSATSATDATQHYVHENAVDSHATGVPNQSFADLRIGRSFKINSNFSMSEDEGDNTEIL